MSLKERNIVFSAGLGTCFIYYLLTKINPGTVPRSTVGLFLIGLLMVVISFISDLAKGHSGPLQVAKLIIVQFLLGSMYIIPQYHLFGWDTFKFFRNVQYVNSPEFYQAVIKHPLGYVLVGNVSEVLGVSLMTAVKYTPLLVLPLVALFTCLIGREIYSETAGLWAGLILSSIYWHSNFHVWATNESLALPVGVTFLFMGIKVVTNDNAGIGPKVLVGVLGPLVLVFYHHLTALIYCVSLGSFVLFQTHIRPIDHMIIDRSVLGRPRWKLLATSVIIVIGYWSWFEGWTLVHFLTILPGASLSDIGYTTHSTPVYYDSLYDYIRLRWTGSRYQYAIGVMPAIIMLHRLVKSGKVATRKEIALIAIIGTFTLSFLVLRIRQTALTPRRIRTLAWIFLAILITGPLINDRHRNRNVLTYLLAVFVILNVVLLPFHVLHSDISPAWDAREQAFGYTEAEYESASWLGAFGVHPVATDNRYTGPAMINDVKLAGPALRNDLLATFDMKKVGYVMSGFSTRAWIQTESFATQLPPKYGRFYHKVSTTGPVNIYINKGQRIK